MGATIFDTGLETCKIKARMFAKINTVAGFRSYLHGQPHHAETNIKIFDVVYWYDTDYHDYWYKYVKTTEYSPKVDRLVPAMPSFDMTTTKTLRSVFP